MDAVERVFAEGRLSVGVVLPVRRGDGRQIDFGEQIDLAEEADRLGLSAIWVRDVPLNGPWYPETIGHLDPWVALGAIASRTRRIAMGTAATVLPLRHPLHVAKAALSIQALSGGRLLLGVGSGDRPEEYVAFGRDFSNRKNLFRNGWAALAAALQGPTDISITGVAFEMRPSDVLPPPMLAIGSAGQSLEWIARNATGWATYHRPLSVQRDRHALWRNAIDRAAPGAFRSFSVAMRIEMTSKPREPEAINLGYRIGPDGLLDVLSEHRELGAHHVMLNLASDDMEPQQMLAAVANAAAALA